MQGQGVGVGKKCPCVRRGRLMGGAGVVASSRHVAVGLGGHVQEVLEDHVVAGTRGHVAKATRWEWGVGVGVGRLAALAAG